MIRRLLTGMAALAVTLTGCSAFGSDAPPPAVLGTYPLTLEARELGQIVALRDVAIEIKTERCLIDLGFPRVDRVGFAQNRNRPMTEPMQAWTNVRPDSDTAADLGLDSLPVAALIEQAEEPASFPELDAMSEQEQRNWHTALFGTADESASYSGPGGISGGYATGGCYGNARMELFEVADGGFGSFLVQRTLVESLRNDAYDRTFSSTAVVDALAAWRGCMATAGFADYADPNEVVPTLVQLDAADDASNENTLAAIDAACFDESRLIETWNTQMAAFEDEVAQSDEFVAVRNWGDGNYASLVDVFTGTIDAYENGTR